MNRKQYISISAFAVVLFVFVLLITKKLHQNNSALTIYYPFNGALFPREFPTPTFQWDDMDEGIHEWRIRLYLKNHSYSIDTISVNKVWKPSESRWDSLKRFSEGKNIFAELKRSPSQRSEKSVKKKIRFKISSDSVAAPILYREVLLPFVLAEKYMDSLTFRLVNVGSADPPHFAMKKFLVCGNCHSFSSDGKTIGLDLDAAQRDKGGYFIAGIKDTMVFDTGNYLSWNKLQERATFGMFSKISPSGRFIATTIKDRVVSENFDFIPENIAFSQLFFPVNGVLAIYDREKDKLWELPGANMEEYVQSNAFWTPDEENLLYCRAKALEYTGGKEKIKVYDKVVTDQFVNRERDFKFDIYSIPFNDGKGGIPKPVKGASNNGRSNFFPAVSPDGKWLVFCQADNYMLLMPDSKLFIIPAEGGKARQLACNMPLMNSWHAWSPNSKWLVFSSKGLSIYTDLFLTHIDEKGNASVPVMIESVRRKGRAANYPEFVNIPPVRKFDMIYNYVNLDHITLAMMKGDTLQAIDMYEQYIKQEQFSIYEEYIFLAKFTYSVKRYEEAFHFAELALESKPGDGLARSLIMRIKSRL